jgi:capsular exopolysaccharide synthesis family protein
MNNVDVWDVAIDAEKPYNISIVKNEVIYFAVGCVLAAGVIFILYYFDRTVKSVEQVETKVKLPIIGKVQKYNHDLKKTEIVVESRPKSNLSEDIRTIRTNLQFSSVDQDNKTLLVCSSVPGEGKSFTSANLAAAFAQTGLKVLIVDADLRLGRIHEIFGLSNSEGLSNLLAKKEDVNYAEFIKKTSIKNLYVMTRGSVPPNPSELLNSSNTKKMINSLKEVFDIVIFDGVPVNGLPDSLIMASMVDRVLVVCTAGYTNIDDLNETKKGLANVNANVAGVVVNKTKDTKNGKYYKYYE